MLKNINKLNKKINGSKKELIENHKKVIGTPIKISMKYRQWLKLHLDELFDGDKNDPDYEISKKIIQGKLNHGKIIDSKYDREDGITLTVELDNGVKRLLSLDHVKQFN